MGGPHNESSPKSRYAKGWRLSVAKRPRSRPRAVAPDCQSRDRGHPMIGVFQKWQPVYAERGIATIPCSPDKSPLVKHPDRFGRDASREIASRFPNAGAFGYYAGPRNGLTVLDVDSTDERILADAMDIAAPSVIAKGPYGPSANHARAGGRTLFDACRPKTTDARGRRPQ
jgi:hypothetical protein